MRWDYCLASVGLVADSPAAGCDDVFTSPQNDEMGRPMCPRYRAYSSSAGVNLEVLSLVVLIAINLTWIRSSSSFIPNGDRGDSTENFNS